MDLIRGQTEIGCRASKADLSISVVSSLSVISLDSQEAEALILMAETNLLGSKLACLNSAIHQEYTLSS